VTAEVRLDYYSERTVIERIDHDAIVADASAGH
jgi:hypothetical protein